MRTDHPRSTATEPVTPTLGYAGRPTPVPGRSWAWIVWLSWVCAIAAMIVAGGSGVFEEQFP